MPHFIVDCTEKILELKDPKELIVEIFETAFSYGSVAILQFKIYPLLSHSVKIRIPKDSFFFLLQS